MKSDYNDSNENYVQMTSFGGFSQYEVPKATAAYQILGTESQLLELTIPNGGQILAETGTMCHMDDGFDLVLTSGAFLDALKRCCCAGESFYRIRYVNNTTDSLAIGLTPNFPAKIIPIDLDQYSGLTIKSGAFMCSLSVDVDIRLRRAEVSAGVFGGQGLLLNSLHGKGTAFLNAGGTILEKVLKDGEVFLCDTNSVVAFEKTVHYDIRRTGGAGMCCCGGEGMFNTVLRGPGMVILQSMPFEKFSSQVAATAQTG